MRRRESPDRPFKPSVRWWMPSRNRPTPPNSFTMTAEVSNGILLLLLLLASGSLVDRHAERAGQLRPLRTYRGRGFLAGETLSGFDAPCSASQRGRGRTTTVWGVSAPQSAGRGGFVNSIP